MFDGHYDGWMDSRMAGIKKYVDLNTFKNKTLLELGCGHGHIGNRFYELGAIVTSSDARIEHIENAKARYPHLQTLLFDGDKDEIQNKYDIILHWGVLYHLKEIDQHLARISKKCDILLLETEVSDSTDDKFYICTNENGYDQAFNSAGIRPSQPYVERVLKDNGFNFKVIYDNILNSYFHTYDWKEMNTQTWRCGQRRFWVCWKDVACPLISSQA